MKNNEVFEEKINLIKELTLKNWIPSEIAKEIGLERHAMIRLLKKANININKRSNLVKNSKVCCFCKEEKLIENFAKNLEKYSSRCKPCRKLYLNDNKESNILSQIKNNAKQRKLSFNLTIEDIVIPELCPILGVKLDYNVYRYSPSVDRIDSLKGYVKGNIQIISTKANNMKNDATEQELLAFSKYYVDKFSMNPVGTQNIINLFK